MKIFDRYLDADNLENAITAKASWSEFQGFAFLLYLFTYLHRRFPHYPVSRKIEILHEALTNSEIRRKIFGIIQRE